MGNLYGYISAQAVNRLGEEQISAVKAFSVPEDRLIREEAVNTGKRPAFDKLVSILRAGDVLVVPSLECLGENTSVMINNWKTLIQAKGVQVVALDFPMLSSYNPSDSMRPLVSELVLEIFDYVNEYQRRNARKG